MTINNPLNSHDWNLESTAKLILNKFPDAAVFVIKPATMFLKTFSVYKNFLSFDEDMVPEFTKNFGSLLHLHSLYKEAKIKALQTEQNGCHGNGGDDGCSATTSSDMYTMDDTVLNKVVPIKLVGFSKGCVVLNQFVYELDHFKDDISLRLFVSSISEMYWLDGGHLGSSGAYVTEDEYLKSLKNLGCKILVHVTPYMIKDPRRNWIGKEVEIFIDKLKTLEANVLEYRHFMDEPGSIENHFKVLTLL